MIAGIPFKSRWPARLALTLLVGTIGGAVFHLFGLPLAWMLGSMAFCAVAASAGLPIDAPVFVRPPMSAVIGLMLGSSVTPAILEQATHWLVPLAVLPLFLVAGAACSILYFRHVAGLDPKTAYFCGMPGGLVEMVLLGKESGADEQMISLVHALRVFLVVLLLPVAIRFIADVPVTSVRPTAAQVVTVSHVIWALAAVTGGVLLGHLLRLPLKYLLGPMLLSAVLHVTGTSDFALPVWVVSGAQVVLGATVGCRFRGVARKKLLRIGALSLGAVGLLLAITCLFSAAVSGLSEYGFIAVLLAYSPGGLAEMSLIAYALNIEVMFVFAMHVFRVLIVAFGASVAARPVIRILSGKGVP